MCKIQEKTSLKKLVFFYDNNDLYSTILEP
jgi:hypothetical protein